MSEFLQKSEISESILSKKALVKTSPFKQSFFVQVWQTLGEVVQDSGILMMVVIAPIIYGFFYPWPYSNEVVEHVPVAIIDNDHSQLSQKIIDFATASPRLDSHVVSDEVQARQLLWQQKIAGYMVIPSGLNEKVVTTQPAFVSVLGNGGYFILNKQVQTGFSEVVGTVSAGVEIKKAVAQGAYQAVATTNTTPVPLRINPMYNPTEGYSSYVVPAVAILILQQMLLMGTAMLVGTWAEKNRHHAPLKTWLARIVAISLLGFLVGCLYYGWIFPLNHYAHNANLVGSLVFMAIFVPTVVTLGCVVGVCFRQRERAMQMLVVSSMPMFFLSGIPWPVAMLPEPLQFARWLLPTTAGMNASVQLNQLGASLYDVRVYLAALLILALSALMALVWLATDINSHPDYKKAVCPEPVED